MREDSSIRRGVIDRPKSGVRQVKNEMVSVLCSVCCVCVARTRTLGLWTPRVMCATTLLLPVLRSLAPEAGSCFLPSCGLRLPQSDLTKSPSTSTPLTPSNPPRAIIHSSLPLISSLHASTKYPGTPLLRPSVRPSSPSFLPGHCLTESSLNPSGMISQ